MNKTASIIVLVILVALGTYIGYGFAVKQNASQQGVVQTEQQVATSTKQQAETASKSVTKDETGDWKVYRNEKYGFELKHPAYFKIIEKSGTILIVHNEDTMSGLAIRLNTIPDIASFEFKENIAGDRYYYDQKTNSFKSKEIGAIPFGNEWGKTIDGASIFRLGMGDAGERFDQFLIPNVGKNIFVSLSLNTSVNYPAAMQKINDIVLQDIQKIVKTIHF